MCQDGTIVDTKSGRKFAKSPSDWKLFDPVVKRKMQALNDEGHEIVIFTNQNGIGTGRQSKSDFQERLEGIVETLEIPIIGSLI